MIKWGENTVSEAEKGNGGGEVGEGEDELKESSMAEIMQKEMDIDVKKMMRNFAIVVCFEERENEVNSERWNEKNGYSEDIYRRL